MPRRYHQPHRCGKRRYKRRDYAQGIADGLQATDGQPRYVYICSRCLCFHITREMREENGEKRPGFIVTA